MKVVLSLACFALFLASCQPDRNVTFSFYAWRKDFDIREDRATLLKQLVVKKIYVKFADIIRDEESGMVRPEAVVSIHYPPSGYAIIPVVYIQNDVFSKGPAAEIDSLGVHLYQLLQRLTKSEHLEELQIDCDWTAFTRDAYFDFLRDIQTMESTTILSSTIRLHQIRYKAKTGVPPVDRGVLMYYNMSPVEKAGEVNSIFDSKTAEAYLDKLNEYPLPLDYALPVYGWCVQKRNGKVVDLLQTQLLKDFTNDSLMALSDNHTLTARQGHFYRGNYFQEGDVLFEERVTPELCLHAANSLASFLDDHEVNVLFFELNHPNLDTYEVKDFEAIRQALR